MANLANTMEANASMTLQAVQRLGQPAGNKNGNGNGNENGEGNDNDLGGAPMTLASFLKVHLPTFKGSTNSTEANNWFRAMEHALQAQHVLANQYVEFLAYQLLREAQHWWQGECQLMRLLNAEISWDAFQMAFYKKYFSESTKEAKEMELMQMKHGSLSVADYTSRFEELYRYSRVCQDLDFLRSGEQIESCEEYAQTVASSRDTRGGNTNRECDDYLGPRGQNVKRNGKGKWSKAYSSNIKFQECGNYHPNKPCRLGMKLRYKYNAPEHLVRDCPHQGTHEAGRSQQQGRGFEKYYKISIWFKKNFRILNDNYQSDAAEGERELQHRRMMVNEMLW
ncbi:uncharacterized protein LOC130966123 [Arachis stenosperma]|uniref:uncharacterized protein LOC130966123 n=1 Tax=Arachis stenosperma TaxID=217475 RepID=UPI0025AC0BAD|nr:uncharacterized protein LOC130966123 [Arachis stenosperma]